MGAGWLRRFRGPCFGGDEGIGGLAVLAGGLGGYRPAGDEGRHAGVVVPYGGCGGGREERPKIDAKTIKKGQSPQPPRQRLAKRKARKESLVKFGLCPMTSECSTAYTVRRSAESPARAPAGAASTEQDRLEPHPVVRQGASRP